MPSFMREITIASGAWVTQIKNATVAVAKAKPMGTPSSTPAASKARKKNARFQLPIAFSTGVAKYKTSVTDASTASTASTGIKRHRSRRSMLPSSMIAQPTGMAAAILAISATRG